MSLGISSTNKLKDRAHWELGSNGRKDNRLNIHHFAIKVEQALKLKASFRTESIYLFEQLEFRKKELSLLYMYRRCRHTGEGLGDFDYMMCDFISYYTKPFHGNRSFYWKKLYTSIFFF